MRLLFLFLVGAGFALILASPMKEALRTFSEAPASLYLAAGLVPLMLIGQFATMRKKVRR